MRSLAVLSLLLPLASGPAAAGWAEGAYDLAQVEVFRGGPVIGPGMDPSGGQFPNPSHPWARQSPSVRLPSPVLPRPRYGVPIYEVPARIAPERFTESWYYSCRERYRSFDPRTGTFLGYDGRRRPCR